MVLFIYNTKLNFKRNKNLFFVSPGKSNAKDVDWFEKAFPNNICLYLLISIELGQYFDFL